MLDNLFDEDESDDDDIPEEKEPPAAPANPRANTICLGHEAVEKKLLELIAHNSLPQGFIFSGPEGVGKATMAFRLARYLLKNGREPAGPSLFGDAPPSSTTLDISADDPVFRRVASGGHPDLLTIERPLDEKKGRLKDGVAVEDIRKVAPFLRMTSSEGGWRIVIIDDADTMTRAAQNSLLKILEEPPARSILVLIAHKMGGLVPTIRSRCRVMAFNPISENVVHDLLRRRAPDAQDEEIRVLTALSEGSIGIAQTFLEKDGLSILRSTLELIRHWPQWDWPAIHHLGDSLMRGDQDDAWETFRTIMTWISSFLLFSKARGEGTLATPIGRDLQPLYSHYSLEQWVAICENQQEHFRRVDIYALDKRTATLGVFEGLSV